jgi:4-diphosphocytidyl-2-C-methyl-D-erythritol kinase
VSAALIEKAPAKINLTLRILGRRADGYHELESLVAFADVADTLTLQVDGTEGLDITGPFAGKTGPAKDNLVLKALGALRQRITGLKVGRFLLEKNIPVAAGLGGGSADAAAALRLVARANSVALDDAHLLSSALAVGADVPVCLHSRPRIMRGIGQMLSRPLDLPVLPVLLVNPGVPVATRDVFNKFVAARDGSSLKDVPSGFAALIECLKHHPNDLTPAASACAPVIAEVLAALKGLSDARLARMSGSGSTCFALFATQGAATSAAQQLKRARSDWWVCETTIGSALAKS